MTTPASTALRAGLITALKADSALVALLGGPKVFDVVPERTPTPYIKIRESYRPWDTTTDRGGEHEVIVNCWTDTTRGSDGLIHEGRAQVEAIMWAVRAVFLPLSPAALSSHTLANLEFVMADVREDEPGKSWLGYARYRAVTEEV